MKSLVNGKKCDDIFSHFEWTHIHSRYNAYAIVVKSTASYSWWRKLTGTFGKPGKILFENKLSCSDNTADGCHDWTRQNVTRSTMPQQKLCTTTPPTKQEHHHCNKKAGPPLCFHEKLPPAQGQHLEEDLNALSEISGENFYMVFHSNCGSILLSFQDSSTGRTTDDGQSDVVDSQMLANREHMALKTGQQHSNPNLVSQHISDTAKKTPTTSLVLPVHRKHTDVLLKTVLSLSNIFCIKITNIVYNKPFPLIW